MNRDDVIREVQERYRQVGRPLNEFERRQWAAIEAMKLGRGGISLVSQALRISPNTIKRGMDEIAAGQSGLHASPRIRKPGGGRKPKSSAAEQLVRPKSSSVDSVDQSAQTEPGPSGSRSK